tara:strand:+ start:1055 stop:1294 length:240 start_codon:yes stop_codon:yes gene_type:complete
MLKPKYQILNQINEIEDVKSLVAILELTTNKLCIFTISEMARHENKSPNGIRKSNAYLKINIGGQLMAIKGIRHNNLPF